MVGRADFTVLLYSEKKKYIIQMFLSVQISNMIFSHSDFNVEEKKKYIQKKYCQGNKTNGISTFSTLRAFLIKIKLRMMKSTRGLH